MLAAGQGRPRPAGFAVGVKVVLRISGIILLAAAAGASGCRPAQPYVTPDRLDRGLLLVLTGIEGRSPINEDICRGLNAGGVNCAIELVDWTMGVPGAYLVTLWSQARNHRKAEDLASRIVRYQMAHPDRPVTLVGQSGGGAMAVWIAESLPPEKRVDRIILLAAALSSDYRLDLALGNSRLGLVSFYSERDWILAGTSVAGTMDGELKPSAGRVGFSLPGGPTLPAAYRKFFQVAWHERMKRTGHTGGHLTSGTHGFVARYVAPLIHAETWDDSRIRSVLADQPASNPAGGR